MTEQPMPKFGDLIKLTVDDWQNLPDGPMPYYVGAKDGLFVHRRLLVGRGIVRIPSWPENFKSVGTSTGQFLFDADPIPAKLMGQIAHFFRRIYEKQQTECMVLLTMHTETKEWGVFIPTQLVSHGGINYVYDPLHIRNGRIVVGSIHSHSSMGPFHSGTDTGDAADFDGFHCTIGFNNATQKIVAMMSMNKQNMHYKEDQFPFLFDWSEVLDHEAPEWWDNYVGGSGSRKHTPVGHELYAKFGKPTVVKQETKTVQTTGKVVGFQAPQSRPYAYYDRDEEQARQMMSDWGIPGYGYRGSEDYMRPASTPWWAGRSAQWLEDNGYVWDESIKSYRWTSQKDRVAAQQGGSEITNESKEFNARRAAEHGVSWGERGELVVHRLTAAEVKELAETISKDDYWEDFLDQNVVEAITDSDCFTEDDADYAATFPLIAGDVNYWKEVFVKKAVGAINALREMGVDAKLTLKSGNPTTGSVEEFLLPGEPTKGAAHHGVH